MEHGQVSSKTWELSLYELHRSPHEIKTDDAEISVSPRSLQSELMCPICLDLLKNTMTTKECLHRLDPLLVVVQIYIYIYSLGAFYDVYCFCVDKGACSLVLNNLLETVFTVGHYNTTLAKVFSFLLIN